MQPPEYREVDRYRRPLKDEECVKRICRSAVHKRVMKMIPLMTFSDDKHHDTYWVQKFFVGDSSVFEEWYRHVPEERNKKQLESFAHQQRRRS